MTSGRKTRLSAPWRDDFGAALVEFALLAPFLLFLALGMSEFGRFLYQYQLVVEGLRDGARYLARVQDPDNATNQTNAARLAVTGTIAAGGTSRVAGWAVANVTFGITNVNNSAGTYRGGTTIKVVRAQTTFNYQSVGFLGAIGISSLSFAASSEQRAIKD